VNLPPTAVGTEGFPVDGPGYPVASPSTGRTIVPIDGTYSTRHRRSRPSTRNKYRFSALRATLLRSNGVYHRRAVPWQPTVTLLLHPGVAALSRPGLDARIPESRGGREQRE